MTPVGPQPLAVAFEQGTRRCGVIEHDNEGLGETATPLTHPVGRRPDDGQHASCGSIVNTGRGRRRRVDDQRKAGVVGADPQLEPTRIATLNNVEGEIVEQFVGEHDIDPIERMVVDHRPQMIPLGMLEPLAVGPLDHHPLERVRPETCAASRGDGAGKGARTGTVLGDDKAIGRPRLPPPCVDGVAHNRAEERPDFRRSDEIAATARLTTGGVEPLRLVVQGRVDKIGHGDRPVGRDARSESSGQRCGRHEISRRGRRPTA